jgi:mono/diheme cytochrome c family protein
LAGEGSVVRKFLFALIVLALGGGALFWVLTVPERAGPAQLAAGEPDLENGRLVFFAGGCASCHATPGQPDKLLLGGGLSIKSPAGSFTAPNISPHPERGIGGWTQEQFATAVLKGTSPDGRHYYPAFPYTTYQRMTPEDARDLFGFLKTLTASDNVPAGHDFPLDLAPVRRGVGLWKLFHLDGAPLQPVEGQSPEWNRGRYLIEALGQCAECHSPRGITGAIVADRRYTGARMPGGGEIAPNLTSGKGGIGEWTVEDMIFFLEDGTTPDGDVMSGEMEDVIRNTSQLPEDDRRAMAVYVKALKPAGDR